MKIFRIQKKNGKVRTIYAPNTAEREALALLKDHIAAQAAVVDAHQVQHGFTAGRSPVTNAMAHRRWAYTLCFDLKDFFDTVTPAHVPAFAQASELWPDGAARQGLPTSPALANLAAAPMDADIMRLYTRGRFGRLFAYTRYADDLCFSFDHPWVGNMLLLEIPRIVAARGFEINPAKTRLQAARAGRRVITGIAVDVAIHPTRETKRRLRAAEHQRRAGLRPRNLRKLLARQRDLARAGPRPSLAGLLAAQARGLGEWSRLRVPRNYTPPRRSSQVTLLALPANRQVKPRPYQRKLAL